MRPAAPDDGADALLYLSAARHPRAKSERAARAIGGAGFVGFFKPV